MVIVYEAEPGRRVAVRQIRNGQPFRLVAKTIGTLVADEPRILIGGTYQNKDVYIALDNGQVFDINEMSDYEAIVADMEVTYKGDLPDPILWK